MNPHDASQPAPKSETALREEEILAFWRDNRIFEKSLEKKAPKGDFVFYDGPPFATGLPHVGHLLSSSIKDAIPRYKTMRGYHVRRRWGWDCHGLPVESLVEKKLGLKSKKDILDIGIERFNEEARSMVLTYVSDWKQYVERIGRWVDFDNSYKTMDTTFIESVWWALSEIHQKGLLYEGRKVLMYCPHCETPLAKAEIAMDNMYFDVTEEAVTVAFKAENPETHNLPAETYFLAWTTTPWTLPGNVALAVGPEIEYVVLQDGARHYVVAAARAESVLPSGTEVGRMKGSELVGVAYAPLYFVERAAEHQGPKWQTLAADFVGAEDGTGIVHTAVIYGEDDFNLGKQENLPMVQLLHANGTYNDNAPEFIRGKYIKYHERGFVPVQKGEDAETLIKADLETRGILFARELNTHSYPHCYRCGTPLIYNAVTSWFIDIQQVKERMLAENENVTWVPEHLKHGRFRNIIENAPDWTISRNRFWASPLPIWKSEDGQVMVVSSIEELKKKTVRSGNRYFLMRHGEAQSNLRKTVNSAMDAENTLTDAGIKEAKNAAAQLQEAGIEYVYTSPLPRAQETAQHIAEALGVAKERIITDERLIENGFGVCEGKTIDEYHRFFAHPEDRMYKAPEAGETWQATKRRMTQVMYDIERTHTGVGVLIISHNGPLSMLMAGIEGLTLAESGAAIKDSRFDFATGEVRGVDFVPLPHNADFEIDLHRPYIDAVVLADEAGRRYERIPEVVDCWVESGSMPFAELHYPFEREAEFKKRFPGDFIAEYIAQTRTWFYYMHAMGVLLFDSQAFKNVVSTGTILAADGSKMSKSKGNYTDPLLNLDRFGADALRFYLLGGVVMQAEDINFRDDELRDVHNRVVNIFFNSFKLYSLNPSSARASDAAPESPHVLDRWIVARLAAMGQAVTEYMDAYDTVRTAREIAGFIDDLSTWYLRRSRDRLKSEAADGKAARATAQYVFAAAARILAPLMPFIAETVYRGVNGREESVHLAAWPEFDPLSEEDKGLIEDMKLVRELVSQALEARSRAGIKVRQPLPSLTLKNSALKDRTELLALIADEVNVKAVMIDESIDEAVVLDTVITEELRQEGMVRELLRHVQELRKKSGFAPQDRAALLVSGEPLHALAVRAENELRATAGITAVHVEDIEGADVAIGEIHGRLAVRKE